MALPPARINALTLVKRLDIEDRRYERGLTLTNSCLLLQGCRGFPVPFNRDLTLSEVFCASLETLVGLDMSIDRERRDTQKCCELGECPSRSPSQKFERFFVLARLVSFNGFRAKKVTHGAAVLDRALFSADAALHVEAQSHD